MSEKSKGSGLGRFMQRQEPQGRPDAASSGEAPTRKKRATKGGKEQLLVYLQPEGIRALKIAAIEEDSSASAIVAEALNDWFQRHGRPPVA